jgi:Tat protein secretion system quality control protein TatD with DNase activity
MGETVERIAALRGSSAAEIGRATADNAIALFRLNHAG